MPFSAGTYTLPAGNPVTTNTTIVSSWANTTLNDISTALSTCVLKDGTQTLTANIPMGGFKLTGLGAGSGANDSARLSQVQGGTSSYLTGTAGTNTITANASPTLATLVTGQRFSFIPANTNTAATTLQIDSTSALSIFWNNVALTGGEIRQNVPVEVMYDGTQYQLIASGAHANAFAIPDTMRIQAAGDRTKQLAVSLTGISTATTRTLTMPDANLTLAAVTTAGDIWQASGSGVFTRLGIGTARQVPTVNSGATALAYATPITLTAEQATTSGTTIDFTGIPSGTVRIIINFVGVSLSGTESLLIQLGDAGGPETGSYISSSAQLGDATAIAVGSSTSGFVINRNSAAYTTTGHMILTLEKAATFFWVSSHNVKNTTNVVSCGAGEKATSQELSQVRITTTGADTFEELLERIPVVLRDLLVDTYPDIDIPFSVVAIAHKTGVVNTRVA